MCVCVCVCACVCVCEQHQSRTESHLQLRPRQCHHNLLLAVSIQIHSDGLGQPLVCRREELVGEAAHGNIERPRLDEIVGPVQPRRHQQRDGAQQQHANVLAADRCAPLPRLGPPRKHRSSPAAARAVAAVVHVVDVASFLFFVFFLSHKSTLIE